MLCCGVQAHLGTTAHGKLREEHKTHTGEYREKRAQLKGLQREQEQERDFNRERVSMNGSRNRGSAVNLFSKTESGHQLYPTTTNIWKLVSARRLKK